MPGHRKQAEEFAIKLVEQMLPGGGNADIYRHDFALMSDQQFENFIERMERGEPALKLRVPNFGKVRLDASRLFDLAEELGWNFFQRVQMPARNTLPSYLTPVPYLCFHLPVRRQAQLLQKKIRVPKDNSVVDDMTGQATGRSKGSKISYNESQILSSMGLDKTLIELLKYRGGDERGYAAYKASIERTGGVKLSTIEPYSSGVKSLQAFNAYMYGMQYESNL